MAQPAPMAIHPGANHRDSGRLLRCPVRRSRPGVRGRAGILSHLADRREPRWLNPPQWRFIPREATVTRAALPELGERRNHLNPSRAVAYDAHRAWHESQWFGLGRGRLISGRATVAQPNS